MKETIAQLAASHRNNDDNWIDQEAFGDQSCMGRTGFIEKL